MVLGKVKSFQEWIEYVGRDHLHHRMERVLGRKEYAVLFVYTLSLTLGVGATILLMSSPAAAFLLIFQAVIILLVVTVLERRGRRRASKKRAGPSEHTEGDIWTGRTVNSEQTVKQGSRQ